MSSRSQTIVQQQTDMNHIRVFKRVLSLAMLAIETFQLAVQRKQHQQTMISFANARPVSRRAKKNLRKKMRNAQFTDSRMRSRLADNRWSNQIKRFQTALRKIDNSQGDEVVMSAFNLFRRTVLSAGCHTCQCVWCDSYRLKNPDSKDIFYKYVGLHATSDCCRYDINNGFLIEI